MLSGPGVPGGGPGRRRDDLISGALAFGLAVVVLGPMLAPGFPLRFDLVSVPRPVLGDDALGLGDRLPRAIPLDSVTALLAFVLPDAWLTQLLGLVTLTLAGAGAGRLAARAGAPLAARSVTVLVAVWNPFVLEQLAIGHLPHLFAYAALPWVLLAGLRGRAAGGLLAAGFGSLTPGGGLLCLIVAVLAAWAGTGTGAGRGRSRMLLVGGTAVLQLPWLVASLVHPGMGPAPGADAGLGAFAVRAETPFGRVVDVLGLGGMWNATALPGSRSTVLAQVSTVLLLGLALVGLVAVLRGRLWPARVRVAALLGVLVGYGIALLPALPGGEALLRGLVAAVPGAGLLRDGHRWLALPALGIAVLAGHAAALLARAVPAPAGPEASRRWAVATFTALLVVASMPDLAWGLGGRLQARHYPSDWAAVRAELDRAPDRARVLVLPWGSFRRFPWTGPDAVLDPAPRLLPRQTIVSDALTVSGERLPEEGPGARAVAPALTVGGAGLTDALLRDLGVGWILMEFGTPATYYNLVPAPPFWTPVVTGESLRLFRAPGELPEPPAAGAGRVAATLIAHGAAGGVVLAALVALGAGRVRRRVRSGTATADTLRDDHSP